MDYRSKKIADMLAANKAVLLNKWFELLLEEYPVESANKMKSVKNQFANPLGRNYYEGLEGIYDALIREASTEEVQPFIDQVVRIKAVQENTPDKAVAFIFMLKQVVRDELVKEVGNDKISLLELLRFESCLDDLALLSFAIYFECKEKIYQLRVEEVNRNFKMLERAAYGRSAEDRPQI